MKTKFKIFLIFLVIATISCATPELTKKTESGYPEGRFWKTDINSVKSAIIEGCTRKGFMICEESQNQIIFSKLTSGGQQFIAELFMGNKYSSHPEKKIKFNLYSSGEYVVVVAQAYVENQKAFGQYNRVELNTTEFRNEIQKFFYSIGSI